MPDVEMVMEKIKTLPESRMAEVLDFVEFLKQKEAHRAEIDREVEEANGTEGADNSWFEKGEPCPVCAKHRDPVTGNPLYNAETIAAIEEGKAMMRGEIPAKRYKSLEEMLVDLDKDD